MNPSSELFPFVFVAAMPLLALTAALVGRALLRIPSLSVAARPRTGPESPQQWTAENSAAADTGLSPPPESHEGLGFEVAVIQTIPMGEVPILARALLEVFSSDEQAAQMILASSEWSDLLAAGILPRLSLHESN